MYIAPCTVQVSQKAAPSIVQLPEPTTVHARLLVAPHMVRVRKGHLPIHRTNGH